MDEIESECYNVSLAPNSMKMVELMSSSEWSLTLLIICSFFTGVCVLLYIETIMFILLRLPYGTRRGFLIFLLGCFPVFSVTSILSIYFPRSHQIAEFGADVYLSVCVYTFLLLIVNYFNGYENMLKILHGEKFSVAQSPCCCCRCWSDVQLTEKIFHRARFMVMQMTVVRPAALFISAILWADGIIGMCFTTYQTINVVLNLIATVSTLSAIYGLGLFYEMSIRPLRKFYVRPKFTAIRIVVLLTNLQRAIFSLLSRFGVITCLPPLPCDAEFTVNVLIHILLAIEMPLLLIVGRVVLSRWLSKTDLGKSLPDHQVMDSVTFVASTKFDGNTIDRNGNGTIGNGHAVRPKIQRSKSTSGGSGSAGSADEVSINSARSAPASAVNGVEVEPAVMPGLRVITSQTSTTSLV